MKKSLLPLGPLGGRRAHDGLSARRDTFATFVADQIARTCSDLESWVEENLNVQPVQYCCPVCTTQGRGQGPCRGEASYM